MIQLKIMRNVRHFISNVIRKLVCTELRGRWTPTRVTEKQTLNLVG